MKTYLFAAALLVLNPLQVLAAEPQAAAPEKENALKYLQQANDAFKPYTDTDKEGELSPPTGEAARRIIEENAAIFPLLERAVTLPLRFEAKPGDMFSTFYKGTKNLSRMTRLLALRSSVQQEAGDAHGALRSGLLCVLVGQQQQQDGGLSSAVRGYSIEKNGLDAIEKLAPQWDAATLKLAARGLREAESKRPAFSAALDVEKTETLNVWRQGLKQWGQENALTLNGFGPETQERLLGAMRDIVDQDDALLTAPYALANIVALAQGRPQNQAVPDITMPIVDANFDAYAWAESMQVTSRSLKQNMLLRRTSTQARIALLQAALAARAYQIEHKMPPDSLQVLAPDYLPAVPEDPFELNAPLQFKSGADGVKIYSVGPDGFDDGGQPLPDGGVDIHSKGDIPAPSELLKL